MTHSSLINLLAGVDTMLCIVALFFLWKNRLLRDYRYIATLLVAKVAPGFILALLQIAGRSWPQRSPRL